MSPKSKKRIFLSGLILALLLPVCMVFAGTGSSSIAKSDILLKDWLIADQNVNNDGTVKGDMISLAQYLSSSGTVEGDLLGAASDVNVAGQVEGDVRLAGATIKLGGRIGKNVNVFSNVVNMNEAAQIGGNLLAYANSIELAGSVKGSSRVSGSRVVLSGEFFGDVDVNVGMGSDNPEAVLHILPGTKIYGKLTYKGVNEALVEKGAEIRQVEWIQTTGKENEHPVHGIAYYAAKYIKMLGAAVLYFFIAMLFYKLFPGLFLYQGKLIQQKPAHVFAVGLAAVALAVAALITFIFLLAVTALIASPMAAFVFAAAMTLGYILLFYFSTVPVSLWLGDLIFCGRSSVPIRFGTGLLLITAANAILGLLQEISGMGIVFSALKVMVICCVTVVGAGAMLYSSGNVLKKLRGTEIS